MSKIEYIEKIQSYLGDGFIVLPSNVRTDLTFNSVSFEEFRQWIDIARNSLEAINSADKLNLIPEGTLSNIVSYLEQIRNPIEQLVVGDPNAEATYNTFVQQLESMIAMIAPFMNLVDNTNYDNLSRKLTDSLDVSKTQITSDKKLITKNSKILGDLTQQSQNLLARVSSGALSENFGKLSNSGWNWTLMILSAIVAIVAFCFLVVKADDLTTLLIAAFKIGNLDYRIFLAKWLTSLPYLGLLTVALFELRNRIRSRDIYVYRKNVAGSLDGYAQTLLNKVDSISDGKEKSAAFRIVIEFMINSMLELTKNPGIKNERQTLGIKVKDILEANVSTK